MDELQPTFPIEIASSEVTLPVTVQDSGSQVIGGFMTSPTGMQQGQVALMGETILVGSATAPMAGIGVFIGNAGDGTYDFRAGNPAGQYIDWDGSLGQLSITGNIVMGATNSISGGQTAYNTGTGFWMGWDSSSGGSYKLSIGNPAGDYLYWDGSNLTIHGSTSLVGTLPWSSITNDGHKPADDATVGAIWGTNLTNIPAPLGTAGAAGLYLNANYMGYWNGSQYASYIDSSGDFYFKGDSNSSIDWNITTPSTLTIKGSMVLGSINNVSISSVPNSTATDISLLEYVHNLAFTATNATTVSWGSGTITMSNGRTFSISAGDTGTMSALNYIYLDPATSTTVLQKTTTASTAMGANKILLATAQNGSGQSTFQVYGGAGGLKVGSGQINIANNNWTYSGAFSASSATKVAWASGTLKTSDGTSYSITGSDTGTMAVQTYIYFDLGTSSTAFQTTTTATSAVGDGKILIAVASNNTNEATFQVFGGSGGNNIDGSNIVPLSITAREIVNATITGAKIAATTVAAGNMVANTLTNAQIAAGTLTATELASGAVTSVKSNLALRGWTQTCAFTLDGTHPENKVGWSSGTLTASDGTAYSISAGNTGTMSAKNYIYLDIAVSTTAYQVTTTATTAIGDGKVLVAIAQNNTTESVFQVLNNNSTNIDASNIVAGSLTANEIAASTITGAKIAATTIAAGNIVSATITATQIAAATITGSNIAATTIAASNIVSNTITATQIAANTITASQIAANTITASQIAANTITASQIAATTITASQIAAGTITGNEIHASTITSGNISVSQLSAITADLGAITAGTITVVGGGNTVAITPGATNAIVSGPTGSPSFILTSAGNLTATSATISGTLIAQNQALLAQFTAGESITQGDAISFGYYQTDGGIKLDFASQFGPTTSGSGTWTQAVTVGNNSNRIIVVILSNNGNYNCPTSGLTVGGTTATYVGQFSAGYYGANSASVFILVAPTIGT